MALVQVKTFKAQCDVCREFEESAEFGGPYYYENVEDAFGNLEKWWEVAPDGRLLCPSCIEGGRSLPALRCTCPCGRGTDPGCPVHP